MIDLLLGGILQIVGRGIASRLRPQRAVAVVSPARAAAAVPPAAIERRAHAYAQLAGARGLALDGRVDAHGVHYRGVHRGRETLFTTGIFPDDQPSHPELQVWTHAVQVTAPVLLTPSSKTACAPEIIALLDEEDVHNVGVTDRFVRIRFEPFASIEHIERAWDALEQALAALERGAIDSTAAPYRG